jgi:hypothetical protein
MTEEAAVMTNFTNRDQCMKLHFVFYFSILFFSELQIDEIQTPSLQMAAAS